MRPVFHGLFASAVLLSLLAFAPRAGACSCRGAEPTVLLASASGLSPATGPWLLFHRGDAEARLTTDRGEEVPLSPVRAYDAWSICSARFELVRPISPLESGRRYRLALSSERTTSERPFTATSEEPRVLDLRLKVKVRRQILPGEIAGGGCWPNEVVGKPAKGRFEASLETDAPALLFLELGARDELLGSLVDSTPMLGRGTYSDFELMTFAEAEVPELETTEACVRVAVRDWRDTTHFDAELCPAPGETLESEQEIRVPEHLVREPVEPAEEEGCGCRVAGTPRAPAGGPLALLLVLVRAVRRRRATVGHHRQRRSGA
jgi:MYXO-CTERM domain-containing protein